MDLSTVTQCIYDASDSSSPCRNTPTWTLSVTGWQELDACVRRHPHPHARSQWQDDRSSTRVLVVTKQKYTTCTCTLSVTGARHAWAELVTCSHIHRHPGRYNNNTSGDIDATQWQTCNVILNNIITMEAISYRKTPNVIIFKYILPVYEICMFNSKIRN